MPVAVSRPDAFERAFPPRELSREVALRSMLWSSAAAVVMCCLLLVLAVGLDLLVHQGSLNLAVSEVEQAAALSGLELTAGPNRDLGLFPTVWRVRERFVGDISARMYRQFGFLRTNQGTLVAVTLTAFLLGLLRLLAHSRGSSLASRAAVNTVTRLRRQLHRQALRLVPGDLTDRSGAAAIALFTDDIAMLQEGISLRTVRLGRYPVLIALLVLLALLIDWNLALLCLIPLFACWYVLQRQQRRYDAVLARSTARADSELRMLGEGLRKTRLVRGYGMEEFEHAQFQQHLERFRVSSGQVENSQRVARASARCLVMAVVAVAVFLIGVRVLAGREELPVAAGGLLLAVIGCLWHPLEALARLKADRSPASLAADRIFHYLDRIPEVGQAVGAKFLEPLSREITFENVVCQLPDHRRVLDGLSLTIPAGQVTAVISLDQLEPQALASLLPRFLEPQSGRVLFDGNDIAWVTLESLRAETVWVSGEDPFFTGTVRDNISCGSPTYSLQDVSDAASKVHAHKFVLKLPLGYETVLGEHGETLEPGQAFQIGLARALLRNPALMVIEEPATPLDDDTKSLLDDAWGRIVQGRTIVVFPTRLSTVRRADQIIVLHRGRVESIGPYSELVNSSPVYRHWEYVRFNEFRGESGPSS